MKLPIQTITACLLLLLLPLQAHAYLDPGTGSIIIQGVIAAIAFGLATIKMWWHNIKAFFSPRKEDKKQQEQNEAVSEAED